MEISNYTKFGKYFKYFTKFYDKRPEFKAFLEITLSTIAIIVFSLFAIKPTLTTVALLQKEVQSKTEIIKQMDSKLNNLNTARLVYEQNKDKIGKLNTVIPDKPNPQDITTQIEGLAAKHSVQLVGVSIEKVTLVGNDPEVTQTTPKAFVLPENTKGMAFETDFVSNYETIQNFLLNLENLRIPVIVDEISIKLNSDGQIIAGVKGRTPYFVN